MTSLLSTGGAESSSPRVPPAAGHGVREAG